MIDRIISRHALFDILNKMPRTGYLIRGVADPETIGEHCFSMSILGLFILEELEKSGVRVDGEKLLKMLLLHETGEIVLGDIPSPATRLIGSDIKKEVEMHAGESMEAKICKSVDKLQMMLKVLIYQSEGRGNLDDFWNFDDNFIESGIPLLDEMFTEIRNLRGRFEWDFLDITDAD